MLIDPSSGEMFPAPYADVLAGMDGGWAIGS
jgi:hypothetical protein